MITQELNTIFTRDLEKLKEEISQYQNEEDIWLVDGNIANSAGNLCLHLIGNLKHFMGAVIGKVDYVRNRDLEFSLKNIPQRDLIKMIDETIDVVTFALSGMTDDQLKDTYPLIVFKEHMSTGYFMIHLATHLGYHIGQINYHRRLLGRRSGNGGGHQFDKSIVRSWRN